VKASNLIEALDADPELAEAFQALMPGRGTEKLRVNLSRPSNRRPGGADLRRPGKGLVGATSVIKLSRRDGLLPVFAADHSMICA
jgi:hypothetical protein